MTNALGIAILAFISISLIITSYFNLDILSDRNKFLHEFINHEYVNILGVIVAITTASASNIHLELRRLEVEYKFHNGFINTRKQVKMAASALIYLFVGGFIVVLLKPHFAESPKIEALFNSIAIILLSWNILILLSLLRLSFKVGPISTDSDD
jgi:hypothetical protein